MPQTTLDYAPGAGFDAGGFTARYLQVLAWVSVAWMAVAPVLLGTFHLDLTPLLLFWAAARLKHHSRAARKWVIGLAGFALFLCAVVAAKALLGGTDGIGVSLGRPIRNPAVWQVLLAAGLLAAVAAVPFGVLLTARAREQFGPGHPAGR